MDKKESAPKKGKPQRAEPTPSKGGGWPAQAPNAGIRRASAAHDRKPVGRGASRGR